MAIERFRARDRAPWWNGAPARRDRRNPALPLMLAGTMAVAINVTGAVAPADAAPAKRPPEPRHAAVDRGRTVREAIAEAGSAVAATAASIVKAAIAAPATITVAPGDTVSDIAARYGLSTPSVLALNGLSWSSLIHPGQVLKLTASGPVAEVAPPAPAVPEIRRHTIASGETISAIASGYGVSTESVLAANGLGWSSLIFPGQTLVIPEGADAAPVADAPAVETGPAEAPVADAPTTDAPAIETGPAADAVAPTPAPAPASLGEATAALDDEQRANARVIISVGRELGVPDAGIVIALATAAQESMLRNLDWGDRDSVGLFQQRPSTGWGTVEALTDPAHAARLFFGGPTGPNVGTRGLLDIDGWEAMPLTVAAQAVQISGYPDAYATWEPAARTWLADLG